MQPINCRQQYDEEFLGAAIALFSGFRAGHIGRYCYASPLSSTDTVRGAEHWSEFIRLHKAYYPYYDEVALIEASASHIADLCVGSKGLIELGSGSVEAFDNKTLRHPQITNAAHLYCR